MALTKPNALQLQETHDAGRVMYGAGQQIDRAIEESRPAVEQLADALQKVSDCLCNVQGGRISGQQLAEVRAQLMRGIMGLQYHDRMTQHLEHIRRYLLDASEREGSTCTLPTWDFAHGRNDELLEDEASVKPGEVDLF